MSFNTLILFYAVADNLVNTDTATEDNLSPLIQQLTTAFDTSATSLNSLGRVDESSGGTKEEVAERTAAVYTVSFT